MTPLLMYAVGVAMMASSSVSKVIDLSHKHGPKTLMSIHGAPGYNLTNLNKQLGMYVEMNYYGSSEHGGTHIDAPSHFIKGAVSLDDIPIEHTILEGVMIDCSSEAAANPNFAVTVQMLEKWESKFGEIPNEAAVLFYFGWYPKYDNERLYRGTIEVGNSLTYIYPYVTEEAGKWLVDKRKARMLGSDTLTVDPFQLNGKHSYFPLHMYLLSRNRLIIENLRDLDKLPPTGFRFHASPVKYVGASGAQIRAYAITHGVKDSGSHVVHMAPILALCVAALLQILL